ncbi:MAG: hypothetical protein E5W82_09510 [Mesorhizobium sp.]|nr:MAG: hypothetical protein E5W82_09510 [Mesorhizobium sp.]
MASGRDHSIAQLARALRSALPSSAVVAERADHPLLFTGPDIVVGSEGNLVAIFIPKALELKSWKALLSRLTAVRLALPAHAKCVLLSTEADLLPDRLTEGFDEVYSPSEADNAKMLMHRSGRMADRAPRLSKIRHQAMVNYGAILHVHGMQASRREAEADALNGHTKRSDRRFRSVIRFGESYVGELGDSPRPAALATLQSFARKAFVDNYDLVDGVPELKRQALDVAIYDADLRRGLDPSKPLRASAFAGWLLTNSAAADDLSHYMESSQREFDRTRERLWSLQQRRMAL